MGDIAGQVDDAAFGQFVAFVSDPHECLALEEEEHLVLAGVEVEGRGLPLWMSNRPTLSCPSVA